MMITLSTYLGNSSGPLTYFYTVLGHDRKIRKTFFMTVDIVLISIFSAPSDFSK